MTYRKLRNHDNRRSGAGAPEAARARQTHLTPVVDHVLLKNARGAVVGLAPDTDRALQFLERVPFEQHEVPEVSLQRTARQGEPETQDLEINRKALNPTAYTGIGVVQLKRSL
jgi:hypothetical protein